MKPVVFIIATVLVLAVFGLPIMVCFVGILAGIGVAVETAFPCGAVLAVVLIVGMGIKTFFFED